MPTCEYGTNNATSLSLHNKELHEKDLCKICNTHPTIRQGTQPTITGTKTPKKGWIQPKKTFINRKVKQIQKDVNHLKTTGNIYEHLNKVPEVIDTFQEDF